MVTIFAIFEENLKRNETFEFTAHHTYSNEVSRQLYILDMHISIFLLILRQIYGNYGPDSALKRRVASFSTKVPDLGVKPLCNNVHKKSCVSRAFTRVSRAQMIDFGISNV